MGRDVDGGMEDARVRSAVMRLASVLAGRAGREVLYKRSGG
jgi:hypothetical protein